MPLAYIGLGANLGQPAEQVLQAIAGLAACGQVLAQSPLYRTAPLGEPGQPDYCNAACLIDTALSPQQLMQGLLDLERAAGRVRDGRRWAARRLDLDLLHYQGISLDTPELQLPHPQIGRRNFVLVPLADVAPDLEIPGVGRVGDAARAIGRDGLRTW
ncbi:2-amino-4-hydroxy-6-hydroxymethyldihydropteridine diphosphokinase [Solimonas sp. K1W22B-7]|uniref:2-amino-4-hydroxy-6- hydroxymethyldihydropteridine diphosphokinase n=1 Tax=Solimonas sp. K1W22B-7 TaxID=2303331 RepID=UPI000E333D3F|nr:2-amino-4-hydroxy-6-hydroxymethyldihydropteridine diphosphokinase [Solimonas sp. K1W22B-7]AXQ29696.1 2-amino-4-hydroxy-6-hydroxymethyldihydropteridine diphosphokinase [Solimonas sp. K1W22B-7]